jgi:hypothetical protein
MQGWASLPCRAAKNRRNRDKQAVSCEWESMRSVLAAILALALGLLPVGTARAQDEPVAPASTMSCHDQGGAMQDMRSGDHTPDHRMQECADHCLSLVNGQPSVIRLPGPSLVNSVPAEMNELTDPGKLHYRDPPDPPPPRIQSA